MRCNRAVLLKHFWKVQMPAKLRRMNRSLPRMEAWESFALLNRLGAGLAAGRMLLDSSYTRNKRGIQSQLLRRIIKRVE